MRNPRFAGNALQLLIAVGIFFACQNNNSSLESPFLDAADLQSDLLILQDQAELMQESGVAIDSAYGVFSLGWNQFIPHTQTTAEVSGHAMAAVFDTLQTSANRRDKTSALDMGDVTISYGNASLTLNRKSHSRRSSNVYTLFQCRYDSSSSIDLEFVPNAVYTFSATGSDEISAFSTSITAPPALLDFNSHSNGDSISGNNDLTVSWSGGRTEAGVVLRVTPSLEKTGRVKGGRHRFQHGQRPLPHQIVGAVTVILTGNPGTYTFSATDIQGLIDQTEATGVAVHVGQIDVIDFDHEGRNYKTILRNGDRVRLDVE